RERKFSDSSCMTYSFVREVQRLTELGSDESRIPEYGCSSRHLALRPFSPYQVRRTSYFAPSPGTNARRAVAHPNCLVLSTSYFERCALIVVLRMSCELIRIRTDL